MKTYGQGRGKRIVVIGGSAAGAACAAHAKRLYPNAKVVIIEAAPYVSYGSCELPFYLGGEIESIEKLQLYTPQRLAHDKKLDVHINTRVLSIDRRRQLLRLTDGLNESDFPYDKLLISTGSRARSILSSFGHFTNVFALKSLTDGDQISRYLDGYPKKRVLILGAGYIALEIIDSIRKKVADIRIVDIEALPLPGFAIAARKQIKEILVKTGVSYHSYDTVSDVRYEGEQLKGLLIDGRWYEADMFIEAMGVIPNSRLAADSGLDVNTDLTIKVNSWMKTSSANIFAAGDVTHGFHALTGKPYYFPLAQLAYSMGRVAAENLLSNHSQIYQSLGTSGLSFAGWEWFKSGMVLEEAKKYFSNVGEVTFSTWNKPEIMPGAEKIFWNIVYLKQKKQILGATIYGGQGASAKINTIALAIGKAIPIPELAHGDYLYAPKFSPMVDGFQLLNRLIEK